MSEAWPSLLQERAEHIRNVRSVALATRIPVVVAGLDELAILYGETATSMAGEDGPGATAWRMLRHADTRRALIKRLEQKAGRFLDQAATVPDAAQAEQLRSLSVIFGAEAARSEASAA